MASAAVVAQSPIQHPDPMEKAMLETSILDSGIPPMQPAASEQQIDGPTTPPTRHSSSKSKSSQASRDEAKQSPTFRRSKSSSMSYPVFPLPPTSAPVPQSSTAAAKPRSTLLDCTRVEGDSCRKGCNSERVLLSLCCGGAVVPLDGLCPRPNKLLKKPCW